MDSRKNDSSTLRPSAPRGREAWLLEVSSRWQVNTSNPREEYRRNRAVQCSNRQRFSGTVFPVIGQHIEQSFSEGFKALCFVVIILGFAVCGWLCEFRTDMLATWGRKNAKTKFAWSPFSSIPMKAHYPTYIRCAGIFLWLGAIAIICTVVVLHFR